MPRLKPDTFNDSKHTFSCRPAGTARKAPLLHTAPMESLEAMPVHGQVMLVEVDATGR